MRAILSKLIIYDITGQITGKVNCSAWQNLNIYRVHYWKSDMHHVSLVTANH
jgi:hypothetical protein